MNTARRLVSIPPWEHWPTEALRAKQEGEPRTFARGFCQRAFSDEERMFPSFTSCYTPGVVLGDIVRLGWPTFAGVDLAGTTRPGNVIFVAAVDPISLRRYPVEVLCGNWKSPETAAQLGGVNARHPNLRCIMVENNGYQQSLIDWIQASPGDHSYWFKIEAYTTGFQSKVNPIYGIPGLEVEFKNKAWVVPQAEFEGHGPQCRCGWCTWTMEVKDYPCGATTDTVLAQFFCREAMTRWTGPGVMTGEGGGVGDITNR